MAELEHNNEEQGRRLATASELLVAARQKSGFSQKEVADELYLTAAFIRYIDDGDFHKISKPAFIKGYLRSYARVVQTSGDEVVERYNSELQVAEESIRIRDVTEETVGSANFTGPVLQTGLIGLTGVIVVTALVWWFASGGDDEQVGQPVVVTSQPASPSVDDSLVAEVAESTDFEFVLQDKEAAATGAVNEAGGDDIVEQTEDTPALLDETARSEPDTDNAAPLEAEDGSDPATDLAIKEVSIERNSDGGINYITLDAGGFDEIEVTFSDECWLEIEDGDGESIYGDLNMAGDVLRVYGIAPFSLLLGRAPAAAILFNGSEVDVARYTTSDNTAKIRLAR